MTAKQTVNAKKKKPSKRVLDGIRDGLEEFEYYFDVDEPQHVPTFEEQRPELGGTTGTEELPLEELEEIDFEDSWSDDEEIADENDGYVAKEEIEVLVDAFISQLVLLGLIRKSESRKKAPSFSQIFAGFFDEEDEIVKEARAFEENIEGYMDWISPDDLAAARKSFLVIRSKIRALLGEKR